MYCRVFWESEAWQFISGIRTHQEAGIKACWLALRQRFADLAIALMARGTLMLPATSAAYFCHSGSNLAGLRSPVTCATQAKQ